MINLFHIPNHKIDTAQFSNLLHDKIVGMFEQRIADYVGAKYAVGVNSATNAIFLTFLNKGITVNVPSMIPPVVANGIITSGNKVKFVDNTNWVGKSYILHEFDDYKVIDSAQEIYRNQFQEEANDGDLMFFSFYPTKPIGSCDGGMIVSNDKSKIEWFREAVMNGMTFSENNWDRKIKFPGYKMYLNSIQAYIANANFDLLEAKKEKMRGVRERYNREFGLSNTSEHLYRIEVLNRDGLAKIMKENGIVTGIHYDALHLNGVYDGKSFLPESESKSSMTLSIPFHENLSDQDVEKVIKTIKENARFE